MTPHDPRFHDVDDDQDSSSQPVASDAVQNEIAALLRRTTQDGPEPRMPSSVEANIRNALQAERRQASTASSDRASGPASASTPHTVVPLPGAGRSRTPETPVASETSRSSNGQAGPRTTSQVPHQAPAPKTPDNPDGASVTSLAEHRSRRKGFGRTALSLGAAAAIAVGALGLWQGTKGSDGGSGTTAAREDSSNVQVTNSQTAYSSAGLTSQAAALETSSHPRITSSAQAQDQNLGDLSTKKGVQACVKAIDTALTGNPEKVYADFGTYEGKPAVIVVVVKDGKKNVWVVNRTCTKRGDVKAGPEAITT